MGYMASYYPDERDFKNFLAMCGRKVHRRDGGDIYLETLYVDFLDRPMYIRVEHSTLVNFYGEVRIKGLEMGDNNIRNIIQRIAPFDMRVEINDGVVRYRSLCRYKNQINNYLAETEKFIVWCNLLNYMTLKNLTGGV